MDETSAETGGLAGDVNQPIQPMRCPRCGKRMIFEDDGRIRCPDCGELYYDPWLGIYRIKPY